MLYPYPLKHTQRAFGMLGSRECCQILGSGSRPEMEVTGSPILDVWRIGCGLRGVKGCHIRASGTQKTLDALVSTCTCGLIVARLCALSRSVFLRPFLKSILIRLMLHRNASYGAEMGHRKSHGK